MNKLVLCGVSLLMLEACSDAKKGIRSNGGLRSKLSV